MATALEDITSDASVLDSSAITVAGDIISDLSDSAIEDPLVFILLFTCLYYDSHYIIHSVCLQVRDMFLNAIDNVIEANTEELLRSQTQSNSSTKYDTHEPLELVVLL